MTKTPDLSAHMRATLETLLSPAHIDAFVAELAEAIGYKLDFYGYLSERNLVECLEEIGYAWPRRGVESQALVTYLAADEATVGVLLDRLVFVPREGSPEGAAEGPLDLVESSVKPALLSLLG